MRTRVWCTSLVLASLAVACGDQPTEVVPEREMTQGPGSIALATSSSDDGLSITTDKDDYQPGDTVWFTGAGWPANDVLDIVLEDEPATHPPHRWTIPVGGDGTFRDSTYVVDVGDLGVTFTLTATSRATGRSLTVQFTDAELVSAELTGTVNDVTVTQGSSANFTISLSATGAIKCAATAADPATATVHTAFSISGAGVVSSNTFSAPFAFFGGPPALGGPNCTVTWTGAPALYSASASVSAAAGTPVADYTITLSPGAGSVSLTNPPGGGGSLDDNTVTTITVHVVAPTDNQPPAVSNVAVNPGLTNGSVPVVVSATVSDVGLGSSNIMSAQYNIDGGSWNLMSAADGSFNSPTEGVTATIPAATVAALSNGSHDVCVRGTDAASNTSAGTACATLRVDKQPPAVTNILPNVVPVNTAFDLTATISDVGLGGSNITGAEYKIDGGSWVAMSAADGTFDSAVENVKASIAAFTTADVHDICVRGTDAAGNTSAGATCILFAVYDPTAGFVTGGGWILYDAVSCTICDGEAGQGFFGFVSKYIVQKDKSTPVLTGNTRFEFHASGHVFTSTEYEWLVVSGSGTRAQYKGAGQLDGAGGYGFLLTAIDGTLDKFRIKVWNTTTNYVVFDNQMNQVESSNEATALDKVNGNGSIVIHVPKK